MEFESSPRAIEQTYNVDKLSYEIFSILESKFLFGYDDPKSALFLNGSVLSTPSSSASQSPSMRTRILSIDGSSRLSDALLAASALAKLEVSLRERSGDPTATIADFFDCAAGSGAGGVLASILFTRGAGGKPPVSASEAFTVLTKELQRSQKFFHGIFNRSGGKISAKRLRKMFGELTLKDAVKPLLVPCYDVATSAPFLFSRADAMESSSFDFKIKDVCEATCHENVIVKSLDGRRKIVAVGGGVVMANPTAAAITHVLNNKKEFPFAGGVDDLLVLSLGSGEPESGAAAHPSPAEIVRIAAESASDTVDQAVALAFGHSRGTNYIRIRASVSAINCTDTRKVEGLTEKMLHQRNVESVLFRGKKLSEKTNSEKLEYFAHELMKEHDRRRTITDLDGTVPVPVVNEEKVMMPNPRESVSRVGANFVVPVQSQYVEPGFPVLPTKSHSALVGRVISAIL